METDNRVIIKYKGNFFKFLNFGLNNTDGSFYVNLVRHGTIDKHWHSDCSFKDFGTDKQSFNEVPELRQKDVHISYHSSGLINYKNLGNKSIYAEPVSCITKPFWFMTYSVPHIEILDLHIKEQSYKDIVIEPPHTDFNRINFSFNISPWNCVFPEESINFHHGQIFSFNIFIESNKLIIPEYLADTFLYITPSKGLYDLPVLDKNRALQLYHQKIQSTKDLIAYSPSKNGFIG